jgi:hypothetical protein
VALIKIKFSKCFSNKAEVSEDLVVLVERVKKALDHTMIWILKIWGLGILADLEILVVLGIILDLIQAHLLILKQEALKKNDNLNDIILLI